MQVLISADGHSTDAVGATIPHYMVVDNHLVQLDLTAVGAPLIDPTIRCVSWGPLLDGAIIRDGGIINLRDGTRQVFWDRAVLAPYLDAFEARKAELTSV